MDRDVYWLLALEVKPGGLEGFRRLMEEMVEATRKEPGALNYEWTIGAEGKVCHILERYRDSAAVLAHLASFGAHFAKRFLDLVTPAGFTVYGAPSAEVKAALAGFGPVYMTPFGGFRR